MKWPIAFSIVLLSSVSSLMNAGAQPAAADANTEGGATSDRVRARDLVLQGTEALRNEDYDRAYPPLAQAWQLRHTYDIAAALGQAELGLKRYRGACEHLAFAQREFPPSESRKLLSKIEMGFASAREHVAKLNLTLQQTAELFLDGASVGRGPGKLELFLDPGEHRVEARAVTGEADRQTLSATAGADYQLELKPNARPTQALSAPESAVAVLPPDPPAASTHDGPFTPRRLFLIGGSAVTLALVGVGIGERLHAVDAAKDARALRDDLPQSCPSAESSPFCARLQSKLDQRNDANRIAIYSFAGAGVTGLATLAIVALWPGKHPATSAQTPPLGLKLSRESVQLSFASTF